jgi:predicted ATPase
MIGDAYRQTGRSIEVFDAVNDALAKAHQTGERFYEAELLRIKGELLLNQTTLAAERAERCFREAIGVARRQEAKSLELRAAMSLGRLWYDQGKKAEAQQLLGEIYGWFTEGFDTTDLKAAKKLLEEL